MQNQFFTNRDGYSGIQQPPSDGEQRSEFRTFGEPDPSPMAGLAAESVPVVDIEQEEGAFGAPEEHNQEESPVEDVAMEDEEEVADE